jgi:hypothetical protein
MIDRAIYDAAVGHAQEVARVLQAEQARAS